MKKIILAACMAALCYPFAFAQKNAGNLTQIITYKVNLKLDADISPELFKDSEIVYNQMNSFWYSEKLSPVAYETFINDVNEAACKGTLTVMDPMLWMDGNKPLFARLTPQEVQAIGADTLRATLYRDFPPYDVFDTILVKTLDLTDIVQIEFMESWTIHPKTQHISKEVIAYSFWRKRNDPATGEFRGTSRMYWVLGKSLKIKKLKKKKE